MYALNYNDKVTSEHEIIEMIFNACRANEARENVKIGDCSVKFSQVSETEHKVRVYGWGGNEVASAVVDKFDY